MNQGRVLETFRLEAGALSRAIVGLSEAEWELPMRCEPWSARGLLGHVRVVIAWLRDMLDAPPPDNAEVSAVEYHRPDERFAPQANTARIALAQDHAAGQASGASLAEDFLLRPATLRDVAAGGSAVPR